MKWIGTICSIALASALATPVSAALGGDTASVDADRARVKGALRVNSTSAYTVHEIESNGTVVREYVAATGKVFAVTWHGPAVPDLQQVLGDYYTQYRQALSVPHLGGHRHLAIETPGFVMQAGGHMRAFSGRAWAPDLLPPNFSVDSIN